MCVGGFPAGVSPNKGVSLAEVGGCEEEKYGKSLECLINMGRGCGCKPYDSWRPMGTMVGSVGL